MITETIEKICDWYRDHSGDVGRRWHCVENAEGIIVCKSDDGYFTTADGKTFTTWNWTKEVT